MQRMSRAQKFLLIYILLELEKPRIVQRIVRSYGGGRTGITAHNQLTNVTANQHHTPTALYVDADAIAAVEGEATLDLTGAVTIAGTTTLSDDLDLAGNPLLTTNLRLVEYNLFGNPVINIMNRAGTDLRDLRIRNFYFGKTTSAIITSDGGKIRPSTFGVANDFYIESGDGAAFKTVFHFAGGFADFERAGDIKFLDAKFPIVDKASGNGIKVDTAAPTFGWRDLLGQIRTRGVGGNDPTDSTYNGNIKGYKFAVNDECWANYHIPHDYVKGTDIFLHFHWSHIGTLVTGGNVTWGADITYSKGHNQAAFPASVNTTVVGNASTTQYQQIITEIQLSTSGGAAGQIDTDDLEPDGVIMIRGYLSANNITVSGGAVPDPFLHFKDIHYQSTNIATKDKVPDFYA